MISQSQAKKLAKHFRMHEVIVVREFIQLSFLKELYAARFSEDIFFKGGTAIRLLHGGSRFSEDLDFTAQLPTKDFSEHLEKLFGKISKKYPYSFKKRDTLVGETYLLTAKVPFLKSGVFVKLDFSMRESILEPTQQILTTDYPIILQNFVKTISINELLAEKVRAIMNRRKHRDLYDLWILLELGASLETSLVDEKLAFYGEKLDKVGLTQRLGEFSEKEFVRDLRAFVPVNEREQLGEFFSYVIAYLKERFGKVG